MASVAAAPAVSPPRAVVFTRGVEALYRLARFVAAAALLIELAVILITVAERSVLGHALLWGDEASRLALSVITFIGGAARFMFAWDSDPERIDAFCRDLRECAA